MDAARKLKRSPLQTPPKKRKLDENADTSEDVYCFKILLTNGTSVTISLPTRGQKQMDIDQLVNAVKDEYKLTFKRTNDSPGFKSKRREVDWNSDELYLIDAEDRVMKTVIRFSDFDPSALNIIRLHVSRHFSFILFLMWPSVILLVVDLS